MRGWSGALAALSALGALAACTSDPAGDKSNAQPTAGSVVATGDAARALDCGESGVGLTRAMSSGGAWSLCFRVDPKRGMVLERLSFTPRNQPPLLVAHDMSLAQLEVPYDTGGRLTSDITDAGFGGLKMQSLSPTECTGEHIALGVPNIGDGTKFGETPVRTVLCSEAGDAGLAYRSEESGKVVAQRHDAWHLSTISKVGWYEYVVRYTLGSDGSIAAALGATGDLSPVDYGTGSHGSAVGKGDHDHAASHSHNAVWRVRWALGGRALRVEQYDAQPTGKQGPKSPVLTGGLRTIAHPTTAGRADRRWWRVVAPDRRNADGRPASYQIDLGATDSFTFARDTAEHGADAGYDVAFTNADACAVFATANRGPCGKGVIDYVANSARQPLTQVVSWIAVGYHHVPRDEDQSPMQLHWQGFSLTPRDVTAQRFDVPPGREGYNGQPETWNGEPVEPPRTR